MVLLVTTSNNYLSTYTFTTYICSKSEIEDVLADGVFATKPVFASFRSIEIRSSSLRCIKRYSDKELARLTYRFCLSNIVASQRKSFYTKFYKIKSN